VRTRRINAATTTTGTTSARGATVRTRRPATRRVVAASAGSGAVRSARRALSCVERASGAGAARAHAVEATRRRRGRSAAASGARSAAGCSAIILPQRRTCMEESAGGCGQLLVRPVASPAQRARAAQHRMRDATPRREMAAQLSYSVWLKPAPDSPFGRQLAGLVASHAAALGTPAFAPHVTLLGGFTAASDVRDMLRRRHVSSADSCARRRRRCERRARWRSVLRASRRAPRAARRAWKPAGFFTSACTSAWRTMRRSRLRRS
jgi:hypothetical protein